MEQTFSFISRENVRLNRMVDLALSKERVFISLCAFSAFLIRFLFVPHDGVVNGDGAYYVRLGEKIVSGDLSGGISGYWAPFYSLLVGISSVFFRDPEFAGRFVSVVAGALVIVPGYFLIREFYGRVPAYLGTVLLVIHPFLIQSSTWVMTEAVYTLIFTTVILIGWYALCSGKLQTFLWTGVLWGIAYLTKPESIGFVALMLVFVLGAKVFQPRIKFHRYVLGYLLTLTGFLGLFVPYVIYLHQKTGQWTISQKIMVNLPAADYEKGLLSITDDGQITMQDRIWGDNYDTGVQTEIQASRPPAPASSYSWSTFKTDISILGSNAFSSLVTQLRNYIPTFLPYPFILVAIVGFFYRPWTRLRTARELYLLSFFVSLFIGYAVSAAELRYIFPLIPVLIAWAANGIVEFSDWSSKSLSNLLRTKQTIKPIFAQISLVIVFAVLLVPLFFRIQENFNRDAPYEEKRAGLWLKNQMGSESRIVMAPNIIVAFYAGAKHLFLPEEQFSTIVDYALRKNADYLVFSERRLRFNPAAFPSDDVNLPSQMQLVYKDDETPNCRLRIYQLSH